MSIINRLNSRSSTAYLIGRHVSFREAHLQRARQLRDEGFGEAVSVLVRSARYHNRMALLSLRHLRHLEAA